MTREAATTIRAGTTADASAIAAVRTAAAERLTEDYGHGHWSSGATEAMVLRELRTARLIIARRDTRIIATLTLGTRKPWAIDPAYFTRVARPIYLTSMAVHPDQQRQGVGRFLVAEACTVARAWPADAIRLDAYDAEAGAGGFYGKCGFRETGRVVYRRTPHVYFEWLA